DAGVAGRASTEGARRGASHVVGPNAPAAAHAAVAAANNVGSSREWPVFGSRRAHFADSHAPGSPYGGRCDALQVTTHGHITTRFVRTRLLTIVWTRTRPQEGHPDQSKLGPGQGHVTQT